MSHIAILGSLGAKEDKERCYSVQRYFQHDQSKRRLIEGVILGPTS